MNPNLSASLNVWRLLLKPGLCLPHHTAATFNDLPIPLDAVLRGKASIKAVVLDKDDCFASPNTNQVHEPYKQHFEALKRAYPGRRLLVVSNTAGATSWDGGLRQAAEVEKNTGVFVLAHSAKKPGCGAEIMAYFRNHPETGVTDSSHVAVVGDRLMTDVMLANMMGAWAFWIRDGVAPRMQKSIVVLSDGKRPSRFPYRTGSASSDSHSRQGVKSNSPILFSKSYHDQCRKRRNPAVRKQGLSSTYLRTKRSMGGKTWSRDEELLFWRIIVPVSPKAAVDTGLRHTWAECATKMKLHFEGLGKRPRRKYTKLMLFEHYYQNVETGHKSPHGRDLVAEHKWHLALHGKTTDVVEPVRRTQARRIRASNLPRPVAHQRLRRRLHSAPGAEASPFLGAATPQQGEGGEEGPHSYPPLLQPGSVYYNSQGTGYRAGGTEDSGYGSMASSF
ncbi:hypothetical protein L249_2109 [Ophiocordyceps polyrhachis-furcata BCC 54312]|uniref:Uncharacterized protein n=1 Tax=Ophiocordyceps polyrhachis-furcata BCC 54312 TaxID=1330021 RepID=A0A367LRV7_9HYPO|nr:hypothetical protein L249_2109 [Ophiocordyceps polyrhachis-furcata BCC 54312]